MSQRFPIALLFNWRINQFCHVESCHRGRTASYPTALVLDQQAMATVSRALRPPSLPAAHVWVGYGWQNSRSYHSFKVQQLHERLRVAPRVVGRLFEQSHLSLQFREIAYELCAGIRDTFSISTHIIPAHNPKAKAKSFDVEPLNEAIIEHVLVGIALL